MSNDNKDNVEVRSKELLNELLDEYRRILGPEYSPGPVQKDAILFRVGYMYNAGKTLVDLGGGTALVNGILAKLGMKVYVFDLLSEYWDRKDYYGQRTADVISVLREAGVNFIEKDLQTINLTEYFEKNSVDCVTSHHCIEHFHQSPKSLLESAMSVLKPNGFLVTEVPNAANIRKRIALLFGRTNYTTYNDYYFSDVYYGHVREYTVGDLRTLAHNLKVKKYRIFGINHLGLDQIPAPLRRPIDGILKKFPGLCASIYLEISK